MTENRMSVDDYMQLAYRMEVYWDEDYWAAKFPELPGLGAGHETWDGLQAAIEDAKRTYFEAALENGQTIPLPSPRQDEFSGKLVLRLARSLHRQAAWAAEQEGVSLNSFIVAAVGKELGRIEAHQRVGTSAFITWSRESMAGRTVQIVAAALSGSGTPPIFGAAAFGTARELKLSAAYG